jgi:hypothetical protein
MVRAAGLHSERYLTASVLETLSWIVGIPGIIAVLLLVTGRGRLAARIGGGFFVAGGVVGATVTTSINVVAVILGQQRDTATAYAVWHEITQSRVLLGFILVLILSPLGLVAMAVGLGRARLVGWWYVGLSVLALVAEQTLDEGAAWPVKLLLDLPLVVTLLWLARVLVAERPEHGAASDRPSELAAA